MKKPFTYALLLAAGLAITVPSGATIYTAGTSGNFSSTSTWLGGVVPPSSLGGDNIIINTGVTLTMDVNLALNTAQSVLQMNGNSKLIGSGTNYLSIQHGQITGTGANMIDVDSVYISGNNTFIFSGSINAKKVTLAVGGWGNGIPAGATINATELLHLKETLSQSAAANITLGVSTTPSRLVLEGAMNVSGTAMVDMTNTFDVLYKNGISLIGNGYELTATGLRDIEIDMGTGNFVTLNNDLTVKNKLKLTSGSLNLTANNNKLIMAGSSSFDPGGTGTIWGDNTSVIEVTSSATDLGTVRFLNNQRILKNLVMNAANSSAVLKLGTALNINGTLDLQKGRLNVQGNELSIGSGATVSNASAASYVITEAGGSVQIDVPNAGTMDYPLGHADGYAPISITDMAARAWQGWV